MGSGEIKIGYCFLDIERQKGICGYGIKRSYAPQIPFCLSLQKAAGGILRCRHSSFFGRSGQLNISAVGGCLMRRRYVTLRYGRHANKVYPER
jgi:hypothetical protein